MNTISSCLIVKNGGEHIVDLCKQLLEFSDEVIITDTGSTDGTIERLRNIEDDRVKLTFFEWIDDFAAARNYSFLHATKDWIFWCDADDSIEPKLSATIKAFKESDTMNYTAVSLNYEFATKFYVPRRRLLKRSANPTWYEPIHEYVMCEPDSVIYLDDPVKYGAIIHSHRDGAHTNRNIRIFIHQICTGNELSVRGRYYFASEIRDRYPELYKSLTIPILDKLSQFDCWNTLKSLYYIYQSENNLKEWIEIVDEFLSGASGRYLRGDVLYMLADTKRFVTEEISQAAFYSMLETCFGMYLSGAFLDYGEDKCLSKAYPGLILGDRYRDAGNLEKAKEYYTTAKKFANKLDLSLMLDERIKQC